MENLWRMGAACRKWARERQSWLWAGQKAEKPEWFEIVREVFAPDGWKGAETGEVFQKMPGHEKKELTELKKLNGLHGYLGKKSCRIK